MSDWSRYIKEIASASTSRRRLFCVQVLWEMLTREVPFKGFEGLQVAWLVVEKQEVTHANAHANTCEHTFFVSTLVSMLDPPEFEKARGTM